MRLKIFSCRVLDKLLTRGFSGKLSAQDVMGRSGAPACHNTWTPRYPGPGAAGNARVLDLRSDAVSKPRTAMRRAMAEAEVGDDGLGEDPIVNGGDYYIIVTFKRINSFRILAK